MLKSKTAGIAVCRRLTIKEAEASETSILFYFTTPHASKSIEEVQ